MKRASSDHRRRRSSSAIALVALSQRLHRRHDPAGAGAALRRDPAVDHRARPLFQAARSSTTSSISTSACSTSNSPPLEVIASDQKRLVVDAFARYKIVDPLLFYQTVGTVAIAESRLAHRPQLGACAACSARELHRSSSDERAELMRADHASRSTARPSVSASRWSTCDPPRRSAGGEQPGHLSAHADRASRRPTEIRAQGEQAAQAIRAKADRDGDGDRRRGDRRGRDILRGEGEARAEPASSPGLQPGPRVLRLLPLDEGLPGGARRAHDTRLVISPDSEFFRYFSDATARRWPRRSIRPRRRAAPSAAPPGRLVPAPAAVGGLPGACRRRLGGVSGARHAAPAATP